MADGTAFYPDQRMTREEALRSYTLNGAYAAFEEDVKGSITPGKLADVVIWSGDPFSIYSHVDQVYIDGALAFDRSNPERQPESDFELGQPAVRHGAAKARP